LSCSGAGGGGGPAAPTLWLGAHQPSRRHRQSQAASAAAKSASRATQADDQGRRASRPRPTARAETWRQDRRRGRERRERRERGVGGGRGSPSHSQPGGRGEGRAGTRASAAARASAARSRVAGNWVISRLRCGCRPRGGDTTSRPQAAGSVNPLVGSTLGCSRPRRDGLRGLLRRALASVLLALVVGCLAARPATGRCWLGANRQPRGELRTAFLGWDGSRRQERYHGATRAVSLGGQYRRARTALPGQGRPRKRPPARWHGSCTGSGAARVVILACPAGRGCGLRPAREDCPGRFLILAGVVALALLAKVVGLLFGSLGGCGGACASLGVLALPWGCLRFSGGACASLGVLALLRGCWCVGGCATTASLPRVVPRVGGSGCGRRGCLCLGLCCSLVVPRVEARQRRRGEARDDRARPGSASGASGASGRGGGRLVVPRALACWGGDPPRTGRAVVDPRHEAPEAHAVPEPAWPPPGGVGRSLVLVFRVSGCCGLGVVFGCVPAASWLRAFRLSGCGRLVLRGCVRRLRLGVVVRGARTGRSCSRPGCRTPWSLPPQVVSRAEPDETETDYVRGPIHYSRLSTPYSFSTNI
jgi:hypothetical protein